jgi:hypothetical protein
MSTSRRAGGWWRVVLRALIWQCSETRRQVQSQGDGALHREEPQVCGWNEVGGCVVLDRGSCW